MISDKIKSEIINFADGYGAVITFRDEIQIGQKDVTIKWSDGKSTFLSILVDPVLINDNNTIQVNTRLASTKS